MKQQIKIKRVLNLREIFNDYDAFIIDLWGVVHDGNHPYPGAVDGLNLMMESGKPIIFMSNTPRPWQVTFEKLKSFNIQLTPDMILTSGDLVISHLQEKNAGSLKYYHLGAERNQDILSGIDTIDALCG